MSSPHHIEQLSEVKTSKLGYLLLTFMAIFIFVVGQLVFYDIADTIDEPIAPEYCVKNITENYKDRMEWDCGPKYIYWAHESVGRRSGSSVYSQYQALEPKLQELFLVNRNLNKQQLILNREQDTLNEYRSDYDLSLQESIAVIEPILDQQSQQEGVIKSKQSLSSVRSQFAKLKEQKEALVQELQPQIQALAQAFEQAQEEYKTAMVWYRLKVGLLQLLFVLPLFALTLRYYFKLKRKDSPYTLIFTAITGALAALLLQVVLGFLYYVLPKNFITRIFEFLLEVPVLRFILYYGSIILVIALFGGIVYYIQRRIFDPRKVAIRRLKDSKCPGCTFTINLQDNYCPNCNLEIRVKCAGCKQYRNKFLNFCQNCRK